MGRSIYKDSKKVLVFNGAQVLVAIARSLHTASYYNGGNPQAVSFSCTGKYISTGGFYFRHLHPNIQILTDDLDTLKLQDYDKMCGEQRDYHSVRDMAKKRNQIFNRKYKNIDETD